ncbi:hypothetical protein CWR48_19510 [Oceanobacillus arenosus]|uniref:Regulatory protein YycH-like domain-containing protein n=1 Tax=Oceanobacillus arenosus TaxID=1229153 RepID=A0A3D8PGK2_9BACI|nr:two-component system regulatory protein YycI [Oceanobacillus arenosus]RDW15216.1 hypothetical protein CWR48_19510 [Oceanobacillus arenosus]
MQWGHIKTLFILSFLILDIYLLVQFVQKQEEADNGILANRELSFEDQLKAENITIPKLETREIEKEPYISVSQRILTKEDLQPLMANKGLHTEVIDNYFIVSQLEDPLPIEQDTSGEKISEIVKSYLLFPEQYTYWGWNKDLNVLIFFQKINDRPVYFNQNGLVLAFLNESNEITHLTQTLLGEVAPQGELQTLIQPIRSIEALYNRGYLNADEKVTGDVVLGYYARLTEGNPVFAPTWKVSVNGENNGGRNYFVNAIEGLASPGNEIDFLISTIDSDEKKIITLNNDSEVIQSFLDVINKLEIDNRSVAE